VAAVAANAQASQTAKVVSKGKKYSEILMRTRWRRCAEAFGCEL
jgi:hypothetical protein